MSKPLSKDQEFDQAPTHALEARNWLRTVLGTSCALRSILSPYQPELYKKLLVSLYFLHNKVFRILRLSVFRNNPDRPRLAEVLGVYKRLLELMIRRETFVNPDANVGRVLANKNFTRSLFALVVEIYLLILEISDLPITTVLSLLTVKPLDLWKHLGVCANLYTNPPVFLGYHMKELEVKIAFTLIWQSKFFTDLSRFPVTLLKRLIDLLAARTSRLCEQIGFSGEVQEEVWNSLKYLLSEQTQCLKNQSLDFALICCVFGVSKLHCEIPLQNIIKKYHELFHLDPSFYLTREVEENDELQSYYNHEFATAMKDWFLGHVQVFTPSVPLVFHCGKLSDLSPSRHAYPTIQPALRTKYLWKFQADRSNNNHKLA